MQAYTDFSQLTTEALRTHCSEAEIFLEIFVSRCKQRGLSLKFGGDPLSGNFQTKTQSCGDDGCYVYLETQVEIIKSEFAVNLSE